MANHGARPLIGATAIGDGAGAAAAVKAKESKMPRFVNAITTFERSLSRP